MTETDVLIEKILKEKGRHKEAVIPVLQAIQEELGFLPEEAMLKVCEESDITPAQITGIASFYSQFRLTPAGKHTIKVCIGTACHVKGAGLVYDAFKRELNIAKDEDTDTEKTFSVEEVSCLGCCTLAPVVQIDEHTYGHVKPDTVKDVIKDFLSRDSSRNKNKIQPVTRIKEYQGEVRIGLGSCCIASGSAEVQEEIEKSLNKTKANVNVKHVGCVGMCHNVPMIEVVKPNEPATVYTGVKPKEVTKIMNQHFPASSWFARANENINTFVESIINNHEENTTEYYSMDQRDSKVSAFLDKQIDVTTELRGDLKPSDIDEFIAKGGFEAVKACLKLSPNEVVDLIKESGLRGRGGAGFPTGMKWEFVAKAKEKEKYIICNGDEGDPGAFMDRMLLESYPYRIIEGMMIAAFATGAQKGILYIRAEYPLAVKRIKEALKICQEKSLIGKNILGSNFEFELRIFEGAGAFVCGEETALIASIEGKRGMPAIRPPFPAEEGYKKKPTLVNNAETFATLPWIIRKGANAFNAIGTNKSKGTKVFALAGKIARGGLIEVPMGITIREIVEQIGGGIADEKQFKAVQIGGPSGGCIPASMMDTPVEYETLMEAGAMMGSGGLVVLDETDCMVDIARYFLSFTQDQSCGKCTFCRVGTKRMLEILERLCNGKGKASDLEQLESLAESIKLGSLCGLGKTAPNPVISTLKYFREEYEAHINGKCPSKKCQNLITYSINENCIGCTKCIQKCPVDAISGVAHQLHTIDEKECIKCDACKQICPVNAVDVD